MSNRDYQYDYNYVPPGRQNNVVIKETVKKGVSFGSVLAMIISYTAWQSIPWAIFHGLLGWLYVIYYIFMY